MIRVFTLLNPKVLVSFTLLFSLLLSYMQSFLPVAWFARSHSILGILRSNASFEKLITNLCKGSSTYSNGTGGRLSLSNITSTHTSPNRVSASSQFGAPSHPGDYPPTPSSLGPQNSPGFTSSHQSQGLPSINQHYDASRGSDYDASRASSDFPPQESRRSSLGSQVNNGMTNLQLNGASSAYGSTNASQTSIALGLQQQRGITNMSNGIRNSRSSGQTPMSPLGPNAGDSRVPYYPRTAPIISANPVREVYNAEQPTTGQPYAFPDPDMDRSSGSGEEPRSTSAMFSRRDSGHTSITSSIITSDSRLPPGQHRLDEGLSFAPFEVS